jgi:prolyl oligopeptidase
LALPLKSDVVAMINGQLVVKLEQDWQQGKTRFVQGALVALGLKAVQQHPEQIIPVLIVAPGERQSLGSVASSRDALIVEGLDNVRGRITLYTPQRNGNWTATPVSVPDNCSADIASTDWHGSVAFVFVTGYLQPPSLWQLNTFDYGFRKINEIAPKFDASNDEVQPFEASSSDGVKIPYFVVGPKTLKPSGTNPTILYAYGGFNVSLTPSYIAKVGKLWLEQGGVFVVANIRGGGEFGPAWHEAGLKTKRQIIYDDFAAVARDLMARKITDARHLGIQGGSNGGLLMGVQMTQHPELWSAVDIQVPLLDMLRFESIAAGTSWVGEYGSVANKDEKNFLASISPYNNLKKGVDYPEAFIWTTTKDDRVGPQHARKFAARLSEFGVPYLFYEVIEGGHGAGANLKETAHTNALEFTYFTRHLMHE